MRILVATGIYPPDIGGPATYSKMLHDELPVYNVSVQIANFGEVRHLPFGIRHLAYFLSVIRGGLRADLIYAQDPVSVGLPAAVAALLTRTPLWLRVPGDYAWEQGVQRFGVKETLDAFVTEKGYALPVRILKRIQNFVSSKAERVIVPSLYLKQIVIAWGIAPQRITVIYSSVKEPHVSGSKEALQRRLNVSDHLIMSAGRLVPWKGFRGLIDAFKGVRGAISDAQLVIVGEGPLLGELKDHAQRAGVGAQVRFTGKLSQEELFAYIAVADVFVLNTAYEGLSHQLVEVMLIGTPIVTTPVGGNRELIRSEEEGLMVPYNDVQALSEAMEKFLIDGALHGRVARASRKRGEEFAAQSAILKLCQEFRTHGYLR